MGNAKYGKDRVNAYLQGIITNSHVDRISKTRMVSINVQLRDFSNNRLLWSTNVTGEYKNPTTTDQEIMSFWGRNIILVSIVGGIIALIAVIIFFTIMIRLVTRPR